MTAPAPYPDFDGTQNCAAPEVEHEWFFPNPGAPPRLVEKALQVCTGTGERPPCPFLRPCLSFALTNPVYGIWGGTTPPTRNAIRQRHGIRTVAIEHNDDPPPDLEQEPA